jgi:hypothetical protein
MAKELFIYTDITVYCNSSLSSLPSTWYGWGGLLEGLDSFRA